MTWRMLVLAALASSASAAPPAPSIQDCKDCPALRPIAPGSFQMGTRPGGYEQVEDTGESPPVAIKVTKPFLIGATEVTVGQFARFAAATAFKAGPCRVFDRGRLTVASAASWRRGADGKSLRDDLPVACVTWRDARAYAAWLSAETGHPYRLPSEAEWEFAARGDVDAPRYWGWNSFEGVSISDACDYANVYDVTAQRSFGFPWPHAQCADGFTGPAPVASFKPNAFGLYDMIGNVWEWTEDCYTASYGNRAPDARAWVWSGGCENRVLRGGGWASRPLQARATNRGNHAAGFASDDTGFRVVREADATP